jgi:SNF family Na+-dependent transporter
MATMGMIMAGFLTFLVVSLCLGVVFMFIDMIFGHRISDSLTDWYDRKFRVE